MKTQRLRAVIVEDNRLMAEILQELLRHQSWVEVVGVATSAKAGNLLCLKERPDIAIVDWLLGDGDGVDLVGRLAPQLPETRWLLATAYGCEEMVSRSELAGADGVVDKSSVALGELLAAIRTIAEGRPYYCAASSALMRQSTLTSRQREILVRLAHHETRTEIATSLGIDASAVSQHIANIARKLNVSPSPTLAAIIPAARAAGVLPKMPRAGSN